MKAGDVLAERYRLVERLGEGGMGEIWKAEQTALERVVAVKLVRPDLRAGLAEATERFRREAALLAKVDHRNVVDVLDFGIEPDGTEYLVMPLLAGETLLDRILREPPTLGELLGWIRAVLSGLAAIHAKGIVHRDLKPANVFLAQDDDGVVPKLIDFGISRPADDGTQALTEPGGGIGTPEYMAPEQFESARDVDARADVWSVGAMLQESLTGRRPYEGDGPFAIYKQMLERPPTPIGHIRDDLAPGLMAFVERAVARDPAERYPDAKAMRRALDALLASGELAEATLGASVLAGARVPRTAAMVGRDERPVSGDAPTEPAGAMRAPPTEALPVEPSRPWLLWVGIGIGLVVVAVLLYDVLRREPRPVAAGSERSLEDAAAPVVEVADEPPAVPPVELPPEEVAVAQAITEPRPLSAAAMTWAARVAVDRTLALGLAEREGGWSVTVPAGTSAALLDRLRGDTDAAPLEDGAARLTPRLVRTTVRLSVHEAPTSRSPVIRILPHDAVLVALVPDGEGEPPAVRRVVADLGTVGWVVERFLAPLSECLPPEPALAEAMGDDAGLLGGATRVRTHARLDGRPQEILLVAAADLSRRGTRVRAFRLGPACGLAPLGTLSIDGVLDELFLTETIPDGGQTLVVTSVAPPDTHGADGVLIWEARPIDGGAPLWTRRLSTGPGLPSHRRAGVTGTRDRIASGRRDPFVLSVRQPGEAREWLVFEGGAIVPEPSPASDAPEVQEEPVGEEPVGEEPIEPTVDAPRAPPGE